MANSVELPKLPISSDLTSPPAEHDRLPFSSVPIAQSGAAERAGAKAKMASDFEAYLNRRGIFRLPRHVSKTFDAPAEILRSSVYKPIETKSDK
jgi:hypothetical protein